MKCDNCGKPGMFWLEYILKVNDTKITLCDTCYDRLNENNEVIPMAIEPFTKKMYDKMSRFVGRAEEEETYEWVKENDIEQLWDNEHEGYGWLTCKTCWEARLNSDDGVTYDDIMEGRLRCPMCNMCQECCWSDREETYQNNVDPACGKGQCVGCHGGTGGGESFHPLEIMCAICADGPKGGKGWEFVCDECHNDIDWEDEELWLWDTDDYIKVPPKHDFEPIEIGDSYIKEAEDRDESERMTREEAEELADKMIKVLTPYVDFIEICGSYRRGREDPGDLDIVIIIKEGYTLPEIVSDLESSGLYTAVNWLGEKKTQIVVDDVKVDIKVSTTEGLGAALLYFTGPSGYNIGMRRAAKSRGMKLNEYGIWDRDTNTYLGGATEEEIYEIMDKTFKPAHKRAESEDYGVEPVWMAETFDAEEDSKEYLVEIRNTRGDVLWRSPCPDYDYLIKEINHMLKTHYYAIDVFTTEYGRKIHMATIKYGKAESGPLAAKLNESLIFRAESFEAELDGMELPVCCGMGWELFPYNGDIIITCQGYTQYFGRWSEKHYCGQSKTLKALQDGILWKDCGYCGSELWDNEVMEELHTFKTTDGLVCKRCYEEHYKEDEDEDFESETMDWTDADLFLDWLKDENIIFHDLTNRTHKGLNYGAFRQWEYQHGLIKPTRRLWEEANFHMFEQTSWELMNPQSPYPFALKAEEGLQVMAAELSGFLVSLTKRAGTEVDMDDWDDVIVIVDLSAELSEDELMMVFPDGSEIELALHNPKIAFVYDEQEDTAELDWVVNLKIVVVDGNYEF